MSAVAAQPITRRLQPIRRLDWPDWCDLRNLPWWTAADAAELDILWRALMKGYEWHVARCPLAQAQEQEGEDLWCKHMSGAVEELLDWRDMREAYSRAIWLRKRVEAQP